ncbi:MAG: hypothetical protein OXB88_00765 [Bacteriovoracales bacterium]|nr:hypothetical protein [Bacteriovoracales bacterium]
MPLKTLNLFALGALLALSPLTHSSVLEEWVTTETRETFERAVTHLADALLGEEGMDEKDASLAKSFIMRNLTDEWTLIQSKDLEASEVFNGETLLEALVEIVGELPEDKRQALTRTLASDLKEMIGQKPDTKWAGVAAWKKNDAARWEKAAKVIDRL